ncbi:hypothetical protein KIPB_016057, partial [Kipferlia bialata]
NGNQRNLGFYHARHMLQVHQVLTWSVQSGSRRPGTAYIMKRGARAQDVPLVP